MHGELRVAHLALVDLWREAVYGLPGHVDDPRKRGWEYGVPRVFYTRGIAGALQPSISEKSNDGKQQQPCRCPSREVDVDVKTETVADRGESNKIRSLEESNEDSRQVPLPRVHAVACARCVRPASNLQHKPGFKPSRLHSGRLRPRRPWHVSCTKRIDRLRSRRAEYIGLCGCGGRQRHERQREPRPQDDHGGSGSGALCRSVLRAQEL